MVLKSQAGVEFILLISLTLALAVVLLANAFHEMEVSVIVASARSASEQTALENGIILRHINYSVSKDGNVTVSPYFSSQDDPNNPLNALRPDWLKGIAAKTKSVVAPNAQRDGDTCFTTTRRICFV